MHAAESETSQADLTSSDLSRVILDKICYTRDSPNSKIFSRNVHPQFDRTLLSNPHRKQLYGRPLLCHHY